MEAICVANETCQNDTPSEDCSLGLNLIRIHARDSNQTCCRHQKTHFLCMGRFDRGSQDFWVSSQALDLAGCLQIRALDGCDVKL